MIVSQKNLQEAKGILVLPFFDDGKQVVSVYDDKPIRFAGLSKDEFDGKLGKTAIMNDKFGFRKVLLYGLGPEKEFQLDFAREMAGAAVRYALSLKSKDVNVACKKEWAQSVTEGLVLASYKCIKFKSKVEDYVPLERAYVVSSGNAKAEIEKGFILASAQNYVRDMNENPANIATPEKVVEYAKDLAKQYRLDIEVLDKDKLAKKKMNAILGVNQGSVKGAYLVTLTYNADKRNLPLYAVVGKGITFDSGGISIKPSKGMDSMKYDKTGAMVSLGVMKAVAELKLPFRLMSTFTVTENMPSGSAQKPGDIVTSYLGKTIEVLNTDAEGRLILADTLTYAAEKKPSLMIDLATLTGACIVALGRVRIGMFSNDDRIAKIVYDSGERTYEKVWRLPLDKEYSEMIKGDLGDVRNIGSESGEGSTITAACFLKEFVGETKWVHLDIAGVDHVTSSHPYLDKGATGIGVRLVVDCLENLAKK
ncbi:MAG: leucyl aminopeptidase [Candidatus Micrarchaeota archaeon]